MTLVISDNFVQWLVVNTLFQEVTNHQNQKDGFRETKELDPYWKSRPVIYGGKYGIEIRIWSLIQDNTHSWVRFLHGANKYVVDYNYNTEVLADLPSQQASQSIVKVFAARSKAKPQRRELVDVPSIIPMNERKWIAIEPAEFSFAAYEISKK